MTRRQDRGIWGLKKDFIRPFGRRRGVLSPLIDRYQGLPYIKGWYSLLYIPGWAALWERKERNHEYDDEGHLKRNGKRDNFNLCSLLSFLCNLRFFDQSSNRKSYKKQGNQNRRVTANPVSRQKRSFSLCPYGCPIPSQKTPETRKRTMKSILVPSIHPSVDQFHARTHFISQTTIHRSLYTASPTMPPWSFPSSAPP